MQHTHISKSYNMDEELAASKTDGFKVGEKKTVEEYAKLGKLSLLLNCSHGSFWLYSKVHHKLALPLPKVSRNGISLFSSEKLYRTICTTTSIIFTLKFQAK